MRVRLGYDTAAPAVVFVQRTVGITAGNEKAVEYRITCLGGYSFIGHIVIFTHEVSVLVIKVLGEDHRMIGVDKRHIGGRYILGLECRFVRAYVPLDKRLVITAPYLYASRHDKGITAHIDFIVEHLVFARYDSRAPRCIGSRAACYLHDIMEMRIGRFRPASGIEHFLQLHPAGGVLGTVGRGITLAAGIRYIIDIGIYILTSDIYFFEMRLDVVCAVVLVSAYINGTVLYTVGKIDVGRRQRYTRRLIKAGIDARR